jgi:hypothetical protein
MIYLRDDDGAARLAALRHPDAAGRGRGGR